VTGIGKIKALVAQRKIRDVIFPHSQSKPVPIVEGRIFNLALDHLAICVREKDMGNFSAMTFVERNGKRVFR
jgi:hypothetical protein